MSFGRKSQVSLRIVSATYQRKLATSVLIDTQTDSPFHYFSLGEQITGELVARKPWHFLGISLSGLLSVGLGKAVPTLAVLSYSLMAQKELFDTSEATASVVPGFSMRINYLSVAEEIELLARVNEGVWDTEWRRRVQRFGAGYGPANNRAVIATFPGWLAELAQQVGRDAGFERFPENCVINEYLPGQGIAPHKDYLNFGSKVACVSLGSHVSLDFYSADRKEKRTVDVPARSLWVIEGEARYEWLHGIAPRLHDKIGNERRKRGTRVSITFRLKSGASTP
jgi:alkylated DNA repair dioxygenase AlkB